MHQFRWNVLRAPLPAASSLMSKPIGPYVRDMWLGRFPATIFSRIVLPDAGAWMRTPLVFPVMLLCSMTLPLLVPIRPIPKSLLEAIVGGAAHRAAAQTEPLPPKRLF